MADLKKKQITAEEKRKYIAYGIIGFFALCLLIYIISDFSGEDKKQELTEMGTPETETEKYNSKLEALEQGKKPVSTSSNADLMNVYQDKKKDDDEGQANADLAKLQEQINQMEKTPEQPAEKIVQNQTPKKAVQRSGSSGGSTSYNRPTKSTPANTYIPNSSTNAPVTEKKKTESQSAENADRQEILRRKKLFEGGSAALNSSKATASIRGTQELKNGQTIKFVTDQDFTINGTNVPKNTALFGVIKFSEHRVNVVINTINVRGEIVNTDISVYSTDGIEGIPVSSDQILNNAKNSSVDEATREAGGYLGKAGKILGGLISSKNKEAKVRFINNQKVILIINSK